MTLLLQLSAILQLRLFFDEPGCPTQRIIEELGYGENTVITHGFFMHTLLHEMKKAGFKTNKSSIKYKNEDFIVAEREKQSTVGYQPDVWKKWE